MSIPRGIRNNDPGNIRRSPTQWQGEVVGGDASFEVFETPADGLRALMVILLHYYRKHGLNTVRALINRWAPPSENDTLSYQCAVAGMIGVNVDAALHVDDPNILTKLACAITLHENGRPPLEGPWPENWYTDDIFKQAAKMALGIA